MKKSERRKLNIGKRIVSRLLSCVLTLTLLTASVESVFAEEIWEMDLTSTMQNVLVDLMRQNLNNALTNNPESGGEGAKPDESSRTDSVTDSEIILTFQNAKLANQEWDTVNLHDVATALINKLKANIGDDKVRCIAMAGTDGLIMISGRWRWTGPSRM